MILTVVTFLLLWQGGQSHRQSVAYLLPSSFRPETNWIVPQRELSSIPQHNNETVRCNSNDTVIDWVRRHTEGGSCDDFDEANGERELCRQFLNITDPNECEWDDNIINASAQQQCRLFAEHLLPHPYFDDVDSILPLFGSSLQGPIAHNCSEAENRECVVAVQYLPTNKEEGEGENTVAPTPAPFGETVPCTRCDYGYADDDLCFSADCDLFHCRQGQAQGEIVAVERSSSSSGSVQVCFRNERSDLFSVVELRQGYKYGCSVRTEEKLWTTTFHQGSTNVGRLEFRLAVDGSAQVGNDVCELKVDGEACNDCSLCRGANDTALVSFDCSNVVPDAVTSCRSGVDAMYGIARKLLVLQEGYDSSSTRKATIAPATAMAGPDATAQGEFSNAASEFIDEGTGSSAPEMGGKQIIIPHVLLGLVLGMAL